MVVKFFFEVVGNFQSEDLWKELKTSKINLLDTTENVYVYGVVTPNVLTNVITACGAYGAIEGGEFICE